MSPYEAWRNASTVTAIRLPADPDELNVVCSEAVTCTLTPKGIQLENCMFNSDHLQAILRQAPRKPGKQTISVPVQVRFNRSLMSFIWVMNPHSKERLQVSNLDRTKAALSSFQITVARAVQNKARDAGQKISIAQAIKKARDGARDLLKGANQASTRRFLKLIGQPLDESTAPTNKLSAVAAWGKCSSKHGGVSSKHSTQGDLAGDPKSLLIEVAYDDGIPILKTVSRSAHQP